MGTKISQYPDTATAVDPAADFLAMADVSDTSTSATGKTKKITQAGLLTAEAPATAASTTAGNSVSLTASAATAGDTNAGAAAGGAVTITSGAAARLTSGNANGGNINLVTGAGIGTGTAGQVVIPAGAASAPGLSFTGDSNTGIYSSAGDLINFATNGANRMQVDTSGLTITGSRLYGNGGNAELFGFKYDVQNDTSSGSQGGAEQMSVLTNAGAGAGITTTLLSGVEGVPNFFIDNNASFRMTIVPASGDQIIWTDGTVVSAATGSVVSTARYNSFWGIWVDATSFVVFGATGTWTVTA